MKLKPFTLPEKLDLDSATATDSYGRFTLAPLEKGWGATVGNSLRRALLSSVQGAAITELRMDGVAHEFSTIDDVVEDVTEIVLNLKKLRLRLWSETPDLVCLHADLPSTAHGPILGSTVTHSHPARPEKHGGGRTGRDLSDARSFGAFNFLVLSRRALE